jgi:type III secretion system chaperone SycN
MLNAEQAVAEFGRQLGVEGLSLGHRGACQLALADGSELLVEAPEEALLVAHVLPVPFLNAAEMLKALQMTDLQLHQPTGSVQAGLRGTGADARLVLVARITGLMVGADDISRAWQTLTQWRARWESNCGRAAA